MVVIVVVTMVVGSWVVATVIVHLYISDFG